jgi:hypothetical protein
MILAIYRNKPHHFRGNEEAAKNLFSLKQSLKNFCISLLSESKNALSDPSHIQKERETIHTPEAYPSLFPRASFPANRKKQTEKQRQ